MTSTLDQTGLTIEPKAQIIADLIAALQAIYGPDINVDSNSPDGQLINIFAQADEDLLELLLDAYNSMGVDTSYGARLDQLVALNGIARIQGTFTQAQVLVTVTQALTLPGMDQTLVTPFTVSDGAGNQYQLVVSHVFGGGGSATLTFQSSVIGKVQTVANTITNIITSTLGVSTANNPSVAGDVIGVNEETDAQLKIRHDQSFTLAQTGPSDAMQAALRNIPSVIDALVVENNTGATVGGIPANSIWVIVNKTTIANNFAIGSAIYSKKSPGCGMVFGAEGQILLRPGGLTTFTARWDDALAQPLYIKFSVIWRGAQQLANSDMATALAAALVYKLGQNPNIGDVVSAIAVIAPTAIVTINSSTQGVSSDNASWQSLVVPLNAQYYYTVVVGNIVIS